MKAPSLKIQIMSGALVLVAGFVTAFSVNIVRSLERVARAEMVEKAVVQARNLALAYSGPLLHGDSEHELHSRITRALASGDDIEGITVVDRARTIRGHDDPGAIGTVYEPPADLRETGRMPVMFAGERLRESHDLLQVTVPIFDNGEFIGEVHMRYSKETFNRALSGIHARATRIGGIAMAVGLLLAVLFASYISRPVGRLAEGARRIGEGRLDTRIEVRAAREISSLAETFNAMAASLEVGRSAVREKERMVRELEIAREIQKTLLPSRIPALPGFELDAVYRPASQVGGDYYDFIPVGTGRMLIVVADVAGKGVPGLVIMAMVRILVRDLAVRGERPERMLRRLNTLLRDDIASGFFVTCFCGILDTRAQTFEFASAAHMPLLLYRARGRSIEEFRTGAKPLGPFPDEIFRSGLEEARIDLEPGDLVLQYTDGLNEMRDASGEEFGFERTRDVISRAATGGTGAVLARIIEALDGFRGNTPQSDDLTLLAIGCLPERAAERACAGGEVGEEVSIDA